MSATAARLRETPVFRGFWNWGGSSGQNRPVLGQNATLRVADVPLRRPLTYPVEQGGADPRASSGVSDSTVCTAKSEPGAPVGASFLGQVRGAAPNRHMHCWVNAQQPKFRGLKQAGIPPVTRGSWFSTSGQRTNSQE